MSAILALFLSFQIGQGFSQCFTNTDCTGGLVEAADERACCVGTDDGLSFNDGTTCNLCIGMLVVALDLVLASLWLVNIQYMGSFILSMMWKRAGDWTLALNSM